MGSRCGRGVGGRRWRAEAPQTEGSLSFDVRIGIDVGSTTVKVVAACGDQIVHREYGRHRGRPLESAQALLTTAKRAAGTSAACFVTGSAGSALAATLGASWVHEVHAVAAAVRAHLPRARTVIELGGQDAKMIHLEAVGTAFSSDMNERCAAGTGATLDRCLYRLGFEEGALAGLCVADEDLPAVSAKCGVFAETDLVNLVKAEVPRERVLAALLDAIVRGNLSVLARGRPLPPQVVLLGGPHAFVPALTTLWRRHLAIRWRERGVPFDARDDVIVPPFAEYFAAEGALLSAEALERVRDAKTGSSAETTPRRLSLSSASRPRRNDGPGLGPRGAAPGHLRAQGRAPIHAVRTGSAPLALGLDAGSTTIKAVVLDGEGVLRAQVYRRAMRGPLEDAQEVLAAVAQALSRDAQGVSSLGVTGYAADILGPVLGADATQVETLAHARSALRYVPDADVVCDVGGQDIKVLLVEEGAVRAFYLSNQCAAGNGALLEACAHDLGVQMDSYADLALAARRAPEFSVGCAVFLDTERVTCQRDGYTPGEILAGMAAVLPRNIWENVVAAPSVSALGRVFVLSGGVHRNQAAVKAHVDYILARHPGAEIVLHPHPGEAGAVGAALAAGEAVEGGTTRFIGFDRLAALRFTSRNDEATRCRRCPSACPRTFVDAAASSVQAVRLVTGQACERGAVHDEREAPRALAPPAAPPARNLLRVEASRLFARATTVRVVSGAGRGLRIAVPRVLSMYRSAPFFTHYFEAIGVAREDIVTGRVTSEDLWRRAAGRGTVDACYPVKVVQAHIADLLARGGRAADAIFFPVLTHAVTATRGCSDSASCPVVAGTPLVTRAAFGADANGRLPGGVLLVTPTLTLTRPEVFREQLFSATRTLAPRLTAAEHDEALAEGRAGQSAFEASLEDCGVAALQRARAQRHAAIVMLARPYHADPGLHHDIGSELWALGRTTLSIRAVPKTASALASVGCAVDLDLSAEAPLLTNSGDGEKLTAARIVAAHPYLVAIEVSSFKCGQDASLYGRVAEIASGGNKPFLALHDLDETRPVASLRLRLRTFLDAVACYERALGVDSRGNMREVS